MASGAGSGRSDRHAAALFAGALLAFFLLLAVLEQIGLPPGVTLVVLVAGTLAAYAGTALLRRTMLLAEFETAGRSVGSGLGGLAGFAAALPAPAFLGLAGAVFALGHDGLLFGIAIAAGALFLAVLVAPAMRKSEAVTLADFLALRYGGTPIRLLAAGITVIACFLLLVADLVVTSGLAVRALGIDQKVALAGMAGLSAVVVILGGMRSATPVQAMQASVMIAAALVPLAMIATQLYGVPVPGAGFSRALGEIAAREQVVEQGGNLLAAWLTPFGSLSPVAGLSVLVTFALGTASLPQLIARPVAAASVAAARTGGAWTVALLAGFAFLSSTYAVFARLALEAGLAGLPVTGLSDSPVLATLSAAGAGDLVHICGADWRDAVAVTAACAEAAGHPGTVLLADVDLAPEGVFLTAATLSHAPFAIAALALAGGIAAGLAAAQALMAAIAGTIAHDVYHRAFRRAATPGRRLVVARLVLALSAAASFAATLFFHAVPTEALAGALALAAGGLFPAIALGVWWSGANARGAFAGMAAGLIVTAASLAASRLPALGLLSLDPRGGALFGLPAGFAVAIVVSLAARRRPSAAPAIAAVPPASDAAP